MKKVQTRNSKKSIGTGYRTVGLTFNPKTKKDRGTTAISRTSIKRKSPKTGARTGCSGCSRSARKK